MGSLIFYDAFRFELGRDCRPKAVLGIRFASKLCLYPVAPWVVQLHGEALPFCHQLGLPPPALDVKRYRSGW